MAINTGLRHMTVVGRVGADPELSTTKTGKKLAKFSVAVNQWDPTTRQEETVWVKCSAFEGQADLAEANVRKGKRLWVSGDHSIYAGTKGDQEQINVRAFGEAGVFFKEEIEEW